jgi:hypothetical protein
MNLISMRSASVALVVFLLAGCGGGGGYDNGRPPSSTPAVSTGDDQGQRDRQLCDSKQWNHYR